MIFPQIKSFRFCFPIMNYLLHNTHRYIYQTGSVHTQLIVVWRQDRGNLAHFIIFLSSTVVNNIFLPFAWLEKCFHRFLASGGNFVGPLLLHPLLLSPVKATRVTPCNRHFGIDHDHNNNNNSCHHESSSQTVTGSQTVVTGINGGKSPEAPGFWYTGHTGNIPMDYLIASGKQPLKEISPSKVWSNKLSPTPLLMPTHSSRQHHTGQLTGDGQTDLVNRQAAFLINPWPANSSSWPDRKKMAFFYFQQLILTVMTQGLRLRNNFVNDKLH